MMRNCFGCCRRTGEPERQPNEEPVNLGAPRLRTARAITDDADPVFSQFKASSRDTLHLDGLEATILNPRRLSARTEEGDNKEGAANSKDGKLHSAPRTESSSALADHRASIRRNEITHAMFMLTGGRETGVVFSGTLWMHIQCEGMAPEWVECLAGIIRNTTLIVASERIRCVAKVSLAHNTKVEKIPCDIENIYMFTVANEHETYAFAAPTRHDSLMWTYLISRIIEKSLAAFWQSQQRQI